MPIGNANMKNTQLLTGYSMMKKLSRYVNVLEIKRHADGERVDVFATWGHSMMELLIGEADEAIKTDVEVARELVTCRGLEAEGERLALVEVVER